MRETGRREIYIYKSDNISAEEVLGKKPICMERLYVNEFINIYIYQIKDVEYIRSKDR